MEKSLFLKWIQKYNFASVVKIIADKINGKKTELAYYHMQMLKKEFSPTLRWGSLSANGTVVAADVVSMDSSLPLKKRDSIAKAEGDIPKIGMKLYLNERTMNDLIILEQTQGAEKEVFKKLFADSEKCIRGVHEQNELMFLQGLSTGVALIPADDRPGAGIRVDYGHPDENKYGVVKKWSEADATPIDDIENVLERARLNGDNPMYILMDRSAWNNFRTKDQVKQLFAAGLGFSGAAIPTPTLDQANASLKANYGLTIVVIDRHVRTEANGVQKVVKPWADGIVVFTNSMEVGTLTYGTLAEERFQNKAVSYAKADDYILVSKYHKTDPVREFTSSQALVVPVIDNVHSIYIMNSEEAADDAQTEGDANFDYEGTVYTKQSVVDAINLANPDMKAKITHQDSTLLKKINKLSESEIEVFEANIVAV